MGIIGCITKALSQERCCWDCVLELAHCAANLRCTSNANNVVAPPIVRSPCPDGTEDGGIAKAAGRSGSETTVSAALGGVGLSVGKANSWRYGEGRLLCRVLGTATLRPSRTEGR